MLDEEIRSAVDSFIAQATVPILWDEGDDTHIDQIGTGTLFSIKGRSFLMTARHVLDHDDGSARDPNFFAMPTRPKGTDVKTLGQCQILKFDNPDVDIAVFELTDEELLNSIRPGWRFLDLKNTDVASQQGDFIVCGYPSEKLKRHGGLLAGALLISRTVRLSQIPPNAQQPVDSALDLFFLHSDQAEDTAGNIVKAPNLKGTSGGSVWEYRSHSDHVFWTPERALKIVGIQSSARYGEYSRAKNWVYVKFLLFKHDPSLVCGTTE